MIMEGTIVKILSNLFTVSDGINLYECRARGRFRNEKIIPLVGDKIIFDKENKYILEIKERKNKLDRPPIANIDSALIVTSVKQPDLSLNLLDKQILLCNINKIEPIIVFTKIDLLNKKELKYIKDIMKYYKKIGIQITTNKKISSIKKIIRKKTLVLTGQTGAGKSTLLNMLDKNLNLETNEISLALGRGKHTTRHVELFKYKDSFIADTPGFSSLDIKGIQKNELKYLFNEFKNEICEFKDCSHTNESNCVIKEEVKNNKILKSRYENYLKFMRDL